MEFTFPGASVDETNIKATGENTVNDSQDHACLIARVNLSCYKQSTLPVLGRPRELPEEERDPVIELVREMNANGWLKDDDIQWCKENDIPIL